MQIPTHYGEKRYYSLNEYCKQEFGDKVYRLSLNAGCTCPNRDGSLSYGGCAFCSEGGSGDFATSYNVSVTTQIEEAKKRIQQKTDCNKFIAYFQAYTNTYGPVRNDIGNVERRIESARKLYEPLIDSWSIILTFLTVSFVRILASNDCDRPKVSENC